MKFRRTFTPHPLLKKERRKTLKNKGILIGIALVLFIALISFLSHNQYIAIEEVRVEGNEVLDSRELIEVTQVELSGNYLLLFSKSNALLYPRKKIKETLLDSYKRISGIDIRLNDLKSITLSITEREGKYLWCGDVLPSPETEIKDRACYFLDGSGYLFAKAPYFSGSVFFKFYGKPSGEKNGITGRFLLSLEEFERLIFFKDLLGDMNIDSQALVIKDIENYELLLASGALEEAPKIIFSKKDDFEKILNNLDSALDTEPFATDFREKLSSLLYIDLRFGNKVIYKFE